MGNKQNIFYKFTSGMELYLPIFFLLWCVCTSNMACEGTNTTTMTAEPASYSTTNNMSTTVVSTSTNQTNNNTTTVTSTAVTMGNNEIVTTLSTTPIQPTASSTNNSNSSKPPTVTSNASIPSTSSAANLTAATRVNTTTKPGTTAKTNTTTTTITTQVTTTTTTTTAASTTQMSTTQPFDTIVEEVKNQWVISVEKINYTIRYEDETSILALPSEKLIEIIINIYINMTQTKLKSLVENNGVTTLVEEILNSTKVLTDDITDRFGSNFSNLHAFYVGLTWFHDSVLLNITAFQHIVNAYNSSHNSTMATSEHFLGHIFNGISPSLMLQTACSIAAKMSIDENICRTTPQPTTASTPFASLPGVKDLEENWNNILQVNFSFLNENQRKQLRDITSQNMTNALASYVNTLSSSDIQKLVDDNVTLYAGKVLRQGSNSAESKLGSDVISILGNNTNKQDLFYIYMIFFNSFIADENKFEGLLTDYVNTSAARRRRRAISDCDRSTINSQGLVCYTIESRASSIRDLLTTVCEQLKGGKECNETIPEPESTQTNTNALSTGAIVGIAFGCFFGLLLIILIVFLIWKYCCAKNGKVSPRSSPVQSDSGFSVHNNQHELLNQQNSTNNSSNDIPLTARGNGN